jgi:hypothetical protein
MVTVSELVGWVCNVVLIKCIFGSGKPRGVGISGRRVYEPGEGMGKLVYEQHGNEVDGSFHRRRVPSKQKGEQRGVKGSKGSKRKYAMYITLVSSCT